ncbi:MAG TPA: redoxin domain-containing protein [Flavipsychrobacter sp.]|nr:redoxin domain-containing protein [Flavipsychrobacter sp.]
MNSVFKIISVVILSLHTLSVCAKDGYKVQLKFTDIKDSMVYLAHYFGKPLPTIFKTDSARIDKNGLALMQGKEKILGGIYIIILEDKKTYFDVLLNNGDDIGITVTVKDLPLGLKYSNSPENTYFQEYTRFISGYGERQMALQKNLASAKNRVDSETISLKITDEVRVLNDFRQSFRKKYPQAMLTKVFSAMDMPVVPEGPHYLTDGKTIDSTFPYRYFKEHYWDGFDFKDDRLVHAPIYDSRLEEYFSKLVVPHEDSVIKEANILLAKTKNSPELYKYTLWWVTHYAEESKIMGMDAVFVYLAENYYMKGAATWLNSEELQKYISHARKIAPNVIGNIAPDINLPDDKGKMQSLKNIQDKYTLLLFWSPDCGHCKQEIPKIDSMYRAFLKSKGVKIYAVSTYEDEKLWKDYIKENKLEDWIHVWDPKRESDFREKYNVYMTPITYVLDDKKIIKGKKLDYINIAGLIEALEKKNNK